MKKILTTNGLLALAALTSYLYTCSMEKSLSPCKAMQDSKAALAMEHNRTNQLLTLPSELLHSIIVNVTDKTKCLKNIIKPCLLLSATCKHLNLNTMGAVCQHYSINEKNNVMKNLLSCINDVLYRKMRRGALLLVHAGADSNFENDDISLLNRSVQQNDNEMITALFAHGANPNQKQLFDPLFFYIEDVAILNQFIAQGVNLHATGHAVPNVLWSNILHYPSIEFIKVCLQHKVDAKKIDQFTGNCILHEIVRYQDIRYKTKKLSKNLIATAQLLLDTHPDIINILNKKDQTPLDIAEKCMQSYNNKDYMRQTTELMNSLIALFKERGGKTAQHLKQNRVYE